MEKVTLKLFEFGKLDAELNGVVDQRTGERITKGLLNEEIKITTKYWLNDLKRKVDAEKEAIDKFRQETIQKYGETKEDGTIEVPYSRPALDADGKAIIEKYIDENGETKEREALEYHPNYINFNKDMESLLQEERELEHHSFTLSDFENVKSTDNLDILFKLIKPE